MPARSARRQSSSAHKPRDSAPRADPCSSLGRPFPSSSSCLPPSQLVRSSSHAALRARRSALRTRRSSLRVCSLPRREPAASLRVEAPQSTIAGTTTSPQPIAEPRPLLERDRPREVALARSIGCVTHRGVPTPQRQRRRRRPTRPAAPMSASAPGPGTGVNARLNNVAFVAVGAPDQ